MELREALLQKSSLILRVKLLYEQTFSVCVFLCLFAGGYFIYKKFIILLSNNAGAVRYAYKMGFYLKGDESVSAHKNNNDGITFEEMYMKNRNLMMFTAMKILNNFADAEDCVSEAFFRAAKIFPKISRMECPKMTSLLVIIVRNAALDKYRANKRVVAVEAPDEETGTFCTDSYSFDSVQSAIAQLKDEYRDVLTLRFVYGYSVKEITEILSISADNAYKRIQRAKTELGKILENGGENV